MVLVDEDEREEAVAAGGRTVLKKMPLGLVLSVCKVAAMAVRQRGEYTADENEVGAMAARAGREAHAAAVSPTAFTQLRMRGGAGTLRQFYNPAFPDGFNLKERKI